VEEGEAKPTSALIHQVMIEDIVLCESAQRGMASGQVEEGRLIMTHEHAVSHFQNLVRNSVGS
jgi:hypothetical protein